MQPLKLYADQHRAYQHKAADIELVFWGAERLPLVIWNDFHPCPEALIELARHSTFEKDRSSLYPGQRVKVNSDYLECIANAFQTAASLVSQSAKSSCQIKPLIAREPHCVFSRTSTQPKDLLPIQCIPHFDDIDANRWAAVHYLFKEDFGGTGFFRHKRTGFESISAEKRNKYIRILDDEAHQCGVPEKRYIQGSTALFELVLSVPAKYNRLILYPCNVLHSGLIQFENIANSLSTRLTLNTLMAFEP